MNLCLKAFPYQLRDGLRPHAHWHVNGGAAQLLHRVVTANHNVLVFEDETARICGEMHVGHILETLLNIRWQRRTAIGWQTKLRKMTHGIESNNQGKEKSRGGSSWLGTRTKC
jgi:hypothetical protein